jgi:hypothetical protein
MRENKHFDEDTDGKRPVCGPRADWKERFSIAAGPVAEALLIPDALPTEFHEEWTW